MIVTQTGLIIPDDEMTDVEETVPGREIFYTPDKLSDAFRNSPYSDDGTLDE